MKKLSNEQRRAVYDYIYHDGDTPVFVYEDFAEDMPYGTRKARDGDPDNWLADRIEAVIEFYRDELMEEAKIRHEDILENEGGGN